jgi:diguanylate cyclase (GGDEF)-like protein/PAS domain S-box-containing protein
VPCEGAPDVSRASQGATGAAALALAATTSNVLERLAAESAGLHTLLDQFPTGLVIAEAARGRMVVYNEAAARILGHPLIPTEDTLDYGKYGAEHVDGRRFEAHEHPLARALGGEVISHERVLYRRADGVLIELAVDAAPVVDGAGEVVAAVTTFIDMTEQRRQQALVHAELEQLIAERTHELTVRTAELDRANAELVELSERLEEEVRRRTSELEESRAALAHQAHHDPLTQLPNRTLLDLRLDEALEGARTADRMLALMFVDLDGFKGINDMLGHGVGDEVLRQAAGRLGMCIRSSDTVARYGGDEFVVLATGVHTHDDAAAVAEALLASLERPYVVSGAELELSASIGVSVFPIDARDGTTLLRQADAAMYRAKNTGKHRVAFHGAIDPGPSAGDD